MSNKTKRSLPGRGPGVSNADKLRAAIAGAVHHAVCEVTGSNGFGHCMAYAVAGATLASNVLGCRYWPQAGSVRIQVNPDDPALWFTMDAQKGLLRLGEFHCWIARGPDDADARGMTAAREMADLSSRHYAALMEHTECVEGEKVTWRRPEQPPPYVWIDGHEQLSWIELHADEQACGMLFNWMKEHRDEWRRLALAATKRFESL